jgi:tRNA-modifying protein YgfZ
LIWRTCAPQSNFRADIKGRKAYCWSEENPLNAMTSPTLSDRSIIKLSGDDASSWLQNLITADIADEMGMGPRISAAALLTPQGKILFDFLVWKMRDGRLQLECRNDVAAALFQRLQFYRLRAKVDIQAPVSTPVFVTKARTVESCFDPRLYSQYYRALTPDAGYVVDLETYNRLRIENGVAESGADYALGDVFPHDVNLDQIGGVGFSKGCFVGQEVVSRMQHRGTARRRLVIIEASEPLPPSGAIVEAGGKEIGVTATTQGKMGLAILRLDRLADARDNSKTPMANGLALEVRLPRIAKFALYPEQAITPDGSTGIDGA